MVAFSGCWVLCWVCCVYTDASGLPQACQLRDVLMLAVTCYHPMRVAEGLPFCDHASSGACPSSTDTISTIIIAGKANFEILCIPRLGLSELRVQVIQLAVCVGLAVAYPPVRVQHRSSPFCHHASSRRVNSGVLLVREFDPTSEYVHLQYALEGYINGVQSVRATPLRPIPPEYVLQYTLRGI
jgi:hypothetical protein